MFDMYSVQFVLSGHLGAVDMEGGRSRRRKNFSFAECRNFGQSGYQVLGEGKKE